MTATVKRVAAGLLTLAVLTTTGCATTADTEPAPVTVTVTATPEPTPVTDSDVLAACVESLNGMQAVEFFYWTTGPTITHHGDTAKVEGEANIKAKDVWWVYDASCDLSTEGDTPKVITSMAGPHGA